MAEHDGVPDLLRAAATADPEGTAVAVDGGERLSYGAWHARSDAVARGLRDRGVPPGARVGLVFDAARWCDYAIAYLAVHKAAATAVPVLAGLGAVDVARILRTCDTTTVVAPGGLLPPVDAVSLHDPADLEAASGDGRLSDGPAIHGDRCATASPGTGENRLRLPAAAIHGSVPAVAEIVVVPRPLSSPMTAARSPAEVAAPSPWLEGDGSVRSVVHACPPGTIGAQHALRAALGPAPAVCLALPTFAPDRFGAALEDGAAGALHAAAAAALLDAGGAARRGLSGAARLVITGGHPTPALLAALAAAAPSASLLTVDALGHGVDRPAEPGAVGAGQASSPATEPDTAVVAAWRRVLRRRDIDAGADFYALGGDPQDATRLLRLVEEATGVRVPLRSFVAAPTPAGLSAAVAQGHPAETAPPVAFSQEGMLWHEHFAPGCQNLPGLARRYRGRLDAEALRRALDEIVRRHAPLRTTFHLQDGILRQAIRPPERLALPVRDLRSLPDQERTAEVHRAVADAGQRPFDLVDGPLFVPTLLRTADDEHVLVIRTHHSVFDDWSVGVFRRELAALYTAFSEGRPNPLDDLPVTFADAVRGQRRRLAGPAGAREARYWRAELDGAPFTTQLPVDDPDRAPGSPQTAGQPVRRTLPRDLHERLRELTRAQRTTVFMAMLTAYGILVHRYTGQDDLILATVVANRNRTELEPLVGCFTKKVPLRLRLEGDPSFTELLARTRTSLLGALAHQGLPFEAVVQDVLAAPAAAHGLVPHIVLMFQGETPRQELTLPGLDTTGFETATTARRAHFMAGEDDGGADGSPPWGAGLYGGTFLIVSVAETADELSCVARGAFHAPSVHRLLDTYATLLTDAVTDPARRQSELRLLDKDGAEAARALGRGPAQPAPAATCPAAFDEQVRRRADAVAVRHGDETVTYAELDDRATRLAARLQAHGAGPGTAVGVALDCCTDAVVAALATWKAGTAWVGIDPHADPERVADVVARAAVGVVVGDDPDGVFARHGPVIPASADQDVTAAPHPGSAPGSEPGSDAVVATAGAEAAADPVTLGHAAVLNVVTRMRDVLGEPAAADRRVLLTATPAEGGFVRQLAALLDGHTLCLGDGDRPAGPAAGVALLEAGLVDVVDCTPAQAAALVDAGLAGALRRRSPTAARPTLVVGTRDRLDQDTWALLRALPGVRAVVVYGPPQTAFAATAAPVADSARPVAGRPLPNVEAHVHDPRGQPVPDRARGILHVGDAGAPLRATDHLARRLPDGRLELCGRVGTDTDLRGFFVDPDRIASALVGCPGVRDVTVGVDRNEGATRLVASVTPDGPAPTAEQLRTHLWKRLPGYACPSIVVLADATPSPPDGSTPPARDGHSWRARLLRALWADELGIGAVRADANYWQDFTFLPVLPRAAAAGLPLAGEHVTRNRTVAALAADLAARRPRTGAGGAESPQKGVD